MLEYDYYHSDHFVTFDVIEINDEEETITLAISNQGKISQDTFPLFEDKDGQQYFEYGPCFEKIYIDEFVIL